MLACVAGIARSQAEKLRAEYFLYLGSVGVYADAKEQLSAEEYHLYEPQIASRGFRLRLLFTATR
jgi:hypothetical protein